MGRLVWLHVPPKLAKDRDPTPDEVKLAISEKKFALGLIEGFAVAVKHHLRTETGMYYADLYYLLAPLHPALKSVTSVSRSPGEEPATVVSSPKPTQIPFSEGVRKRPNHPAVQAVLTASPHIDYGTINQYPRAEEVDEHQPLLPSMPRRKQTVAQAVSVSMIPFWTIFVWIWNVATLKSFRKVEQLEEDDRRQSTPYSHRKRRPKVAGGGTNLPLDVIRALSEWLAVLDTRGTVNGYEENDLDLDLFILEIIHYDIDALLARSSPNSYATLKATGHDQANANTSQGLLADYGRILQAAKTRKHDDAQSAPKNTSAPKEAPVELGAAPTIIHALADRSDAPLQKASTLLAASEP
ncbi:hypothetical protein FRB99_006455 [Tulasnella sp. 403]|nr:hypothetical protein FRB99_006455 [Tulasnella sp. 403]